VLFKALEQALDRGYNTVIRYDFSDCFYGKNSAYERVADMDIRVKVERHFTMYSKVWDTDKVTMIASPLDYYNEIKSKCEERGQFMHG